MSGKRPLVLGLTGSIGMGKSTTAGFFREQDVPVWDADAAVHRLYAKDGAAVAQMAEICPAAIKDGAVDRAALRDWIARDDTAIKQLESVVHPLVAQDRHDFISHAQMAGKPLVVVDVPLLFETGGDSYVDFTLVVTATAHIQKARVLKREGMTEAHFDKILASQMPDEEKRKRADFVLETTSLESAKDSVARILTELRDRSEHNA